jgi:hypothetical protein
MKPDGWLNHFSSFMKHSKKDKALLMVDEHSSCKQVNVLSVAKEYDIVMVCPPPHSTHQLQPLNVSFYGQLKTYTVSKFRSG